MGNSFCSNFCLFVFVNPVSFETTALPNAQVLIQLVVYGFTVVYTVSVVG